MQIGIVDLRFRSGAEKREGVTIYSLGFAKVRNIVPEDRQHEGQHG